MASGYRARRGSPRQRSEYASHSTCVNTDLPKGARACACTSLPGAMLVSGLWWWPCLHHVVRGQSVCGSSVCAAREEGTEGPLCHVPSSSPPFR